jgi:hypothetical protein
MAAYFEAAKQRPAKLASNWIMGECRGASTR